MIRKLDKIVVIDLEATCWDEEPPYGLISDIGFAVIIKDSGFDVSPSMKFKY